MSVSDTHSLFFLLHSCKPQLSDSTVLHDGCTSREAVWVSNAAAPRSPRHVSRAASPSLAVTRAQASTLTPHPPLPLLQIRKSNAFANYEAEQTAATSASTKAATAHDQFRQDAARERMAKRKLQRLTDRCVPSHSPEPGIPLNLQPRTCNPAVGRAEGGCVTLGANLRPHPGGYLR